MLRVHTGLAFDWHGFDFQHSSCKRDPHQLICIQTLQSEKLPALARALGYKLGLHDDTAPLRM
jgi:hypothetical protein